MNNTNPSETDFYDPPILHHGLGPGDLVRTRPVFTPQPVGASGAWQIIYTSTDSRSQLIPASGIVLIPETMAEPGSTAILLYCPSFRGLGGRCAPSQLLATGTEPDVAGIEAALEKGWVVAIPDGRGLGVGAGPHTFLAARANAKLVLDLARAVYRSANLDLDVPVAPVVAWGYADGGRVAAATGELQPWYAPEVDLRGIAAGAVVTDLAALAPAIGRGPGAGLGLAGLIGLSRAYDQLPLRHVLTDEGVLAVAEAQHLTAVELLLQYWQPLQHWCRLEDPWNDTWWRRVLALETLAHVPVEVPLHLYHGERDSLIPVQAGRKTLVAYRQRATAVSWREYDADHRATAQAAISDVLAHLAHDITSRPASSPRSAKAVGESTERTSHH
ncbi:lipase family protein [Nocardia sp. NPDC058176]|uniref:lipase family protein n=1 Tax=Nocardia sp. NPDC058176 TaxID=3346368 RepID=UPI0036D874CC